MTPTLQMIQMRRKKKHSVIHRWVEQLRLNLFDQGMAATLHRYRDCEMPIHDLFALSKNRNS